ncbi:MAG: Ig-like domain-containing protein [Gemmatimonadota bacterium]
MGTLRTACVSRYAHVARVVACAFALVSAGCRLDSAVPGISFEDDTAAPDFGVVELTGLHRDALIALDQARPTTEQWNKVLGVFVGTAIPADSSTMAVLGSYEVLDDRVRFTPRFPPMPGQAYSVRFNGTALPIPISNVVIDTTVEISRAHSAEPARVIAVYPSTDRVPMNLLRLYVHFSAPMSTGGAYQRIRVLDAAGKVVEDAFLVIAGEQELWDPEHRRLTMLFDPGRIKRDLRPHEELGLPLRDGQSYTLVIDSTWTDANGNAVAAGFRKRFSVGPADRAVPNTADWRVAVPVVGTRAVLTVTFPEPLDHALLLRLLVVKASAGQTVAGQATVGANEESWTFTPAAAWRAGEYAIDIGTDLEDLAGNNLRDVFDVDRNARAKQTVTSERVSLPFTVGVR